MKNNSPYIAIANFIAKVQFASNRGNKDLKMTMAEAINLSSDLSKLLLASNDLLESNASLMTKLSETSTNNLVDGGKF
jgi:hypothetical protein